MMVRADRHNVTGCEGARLPCGDRDNMICLDVRLAVRLEEPDWVPPQRCAELAAEAVRPLDGISDRAALNEAAYPLLELRYGPAVALLVPDDFVQVCSC